MKFMRQKSTGRIGIIGVDPYGIRSHGEIIVSFAPATDSNRYLGNGYPRKQFERVDEKDLTRYYRKKYRV